MKKIIALNTSSREKNTYTLLKRIETELLKQEIEMNIINLHHFEIKYCKGCELCITKDICPLEDDILKINQLLIEADGLIFSTPVYMENLSGLLKTFIDRNCKWFHRSPLIKKPFLAVSTTMSSGLKPTLKYLETVATRWGMVPCGSISRRLRTFDKPISERELSSFIRFVKNPKKIFQFISPSKTINFNVQKALALNLFEIDKLYWEKHGLDDKNYYYKAIADPFTTILGKLLFKTISKNIKQNDQKI